MEFAEENWNPPSLISSASPLSEKSFFTPVCVHGATIAFKDMALSILPHLMITAARKNQVKNEIVILTATSGDTGKAALAGFADVEGTRIIVFYPKDGVSPVQEKFLNTFIQGRDVIRHKQPSIRGKSLQDRLRRPYRLPAASCTSV